MVVQDMKKIPRILKYRVYYGRNVLMFYKRQRTPMEQCKMDNSEKLETQGTQDEEKQSKKTMHYVLDTTIRKQKQLA